jgi:hypothetical protein
VTLVLSQTYLFVHIELSIVWRLNSNKSLAPNMMNVHGIDVVDIFCSSWPIGVAA